jgi:hypothetical protein
MFTVTTISAAEIRSELSPFESQLGALWERINSLGGIEPEERRPFIQLSAHDILEEEEEEIFDCAGIPMAAAPIGLPLEIQPLLLGEDPRQQILLFPLDMFYSHLRRVAPNVVAAYEEAASLQAFLDGRSNEVTAKEYLCAGLVDCIQYCKREGEALTIRW